MRSRTIPFLMVLVLLAGCESPSASKTITAAYEPIEVNANTPLAAVTPKLGDSSWKGTWEAANLPEGLIIDTANGAIRGTPTTVSAKADYSVTLTGTGDFLGVDGEATVSITVNEQVISAAYSQIEAVVNSAVAVSPVLDDSEWEGTWAANLPEGLIIDTASGDISGTPTAVSDKTDYGVTLTGTGDFLGVDGEAAVSITILPHAPLNLSAAQLEIIDGTKSDGTMKHASNFMVFDITTSDTVSSAIAVEFLLVKDGDEEPTSLDAFRKTVAVTLIGGTYDLVMTHKSAMLPSGATSVYLSHDSAGRYPLKPGTAYKLYEAQPDSDDSSPKSLGSFTTGTHAAYPGNLMQHIEDPGTAGNSGRFYTENEQFFVITSLWGQARGPGDGFAIKREGASLTSGGIDIIRNASIFRDFDTFLDQSEKPFPFFHAILGGEQFFEQARNSPTASDIPFTPAEVQLFSKEYKRWTELSLQGETRVFNEFDDRLKTAPASTDIRLVKSTPYASGLSPRILIGDSSRSLSNHHKISSIALWSLL